MRITWSIGLPPPEKDGGCHLMISYDADGTQGEIIYHAAYDDIRPVINILDKVFPGEIVEYSLDAESNIIVGGKHAQA